MIKILGIVLAGILLSGCFFTPEAPPPQVIVQTKYKVVSIPDELYDCPRITNWPKYKTLTDVEVAKLLVKLESNSRQCQATIAAIKAYIKTAKQIIR